MESLFLNLLNMSITASWLSLAVMLVRFIFKNAPKSLRLVLWTFVGIRLICPFSFESIFSLIPSAQTVPPDIMYSPSPSVSTGIPAVNAVINPIVSESFTPDPSYSANPLQIVTFAASVLWLIGIGAMLLYALISCISLRSKLKKAVKFEDNIYVCEKVSTPFIFGLVKPKIYLPENLKSDDLKYVIAHEKAHIKRLDHLWKPLSFLILTVYWFNPILWLSYIFLSKDMELACDEKVIREMGKEIKKPYSSALLNCSIKRKELTLCPLAFGEVGVSSRIKAVLRYKKPATVIVILSVVISIVIGAAFLTNPKSKTEDDVASQIQNQSFFSDYEGISAIIISADLSAPAPYIEVKYDNSTEKELIYGEMFHIKKFENEAWKDTRKNKEYIWHTIGYYIRPYGVSTKKYYLRDLDMDEAGHYRFETTFGIVGGKAEENYIIQIAFDLKEKVTENLSFILDPVELVYDAPVFSYVQFPEYAPEYKISDMGIYEINRENGLLYYHGHLEEINLSTDNFDLRFNKTVGWYGDYSLKNIKKNNYRAWQLQENTKKGEKSGSLYLLLLQNDGTYLLGLGTYGAGTDSPKSSDDSYIRFFYKADITSKNKNPEASEASLIKLYSYKNSYEKDPPEIRLYDDGSFQFVYSLFSSYIPRGFYTMSDSSLLLTTNDAKRLTYVFDIKKDGSLVFDAPASAEMPKYAYLGEGKGSFICVPHEAVFTEEYISSPYVHNTKEFDVDGDGKTEVCSILPGLTSGRFTFIISAREKGQSEEKYRNIFEPGAAAEFTFITDEKGNTQIKSVSTQNDEDEIIYDIGVDNDNIYLSFDNGKKRVAYG